MKHKPGHHSVVESTTGSVVTPPPPPNTHGTSSCRKRLLRDKRHWSAPSIREMRIGDSTGSGAYAILGETYDSYPDS